MGEFRMLFAASNAQHSGGFSEYSTGWMVHLDSIAWKIFGLRLGTGLRVSEEGRMGLLPRKRNTCPETFPQPLHCDLELSVRTRGLIACHDSASVGVSNPLILVGSPSS
jgi:hypothetical protein